MRLPDKPKVSYTLAQLHDQTGASEQTWRRLIRTGKLKAVRLGSRILVTHESLVSCLKAHEDSSPARKAPAWMADPERRAAAVVKRKQTMVQLAEAER